jgi:UDP-N-acetylglucosamine 2-epimerase
MSRKKIISVVGARPQFIKLAPLSRAIRKEFDEIIIHTGQHYDEGMSDIFFKELGIPTPDYNLGIGSNLPCKQIALMLIELEEIFLKEKPDCVIVFGDTNSTAAASIAAIKTKSKLAHIEAGLREFNKYIPEESNKLITDILSDFYFCPTPKAIEILKSMGLTQHAYNVGDVMIDIIEQNIPVIEANQEAIYKRFDIKHKEYCFMTCHRASNTDDVDNLKNILEAIQSFSEKVIFPIHPRTLKVVKENGLENLINQPNIILTEPLGYIDSQTLIRFAKFVYTDSGGITKEAYFHHTPGILTDTQTEWVETVDEGWNQQAGPKKENIIAAYHKISSPTFNSNCLGDGKASEKITSILKQYL